MSKDKVFSLRSFKKSNILCMKKSQGYVKGISLVGLTGAQKKQVKSVGHGHSRSYVKQLVTAMKRGRSYMSASALARQNCIV